MKLLTTREAAQTLGVSERRVRALIADGKLKAERVGRDYVIVDKDLENVRTYGKSGRPPKSND